MLKFEKALLYLTYLFILSACKPTSIKPAVDTNFILLEQQEVYRLIGKMSFSDGRDGGSGRIQWVSNKGMVSAQLKAPLGVKSWQIEESGNGAKLTDDEGRLIYAESATELVSNQFGWNVPWEALKNWVVGQAFDVDKATLNWIEGEYIIRENDWHITYSKIKTFPEGLLPMKIVARKGDYSIKVAVKSWHW